jgi:predicted histone-like DNA-binding protein
MLLKYKVVSTFRPGEGKTGRKLWFPKLTGSSRAGLPEIAEMLEKRSTASGADVYLIIKGLVDLIPELLTEGNTVRLNELGTFRLHAKVNVRDSAEEVSVKDIRELRISFIPEKGIKKKLKEAEITLENL